MSIPARKKSVVGGLSQIEIPQPTQSSTLLNKSASQSTSLYKQCTSLRARLMRIHDFPPFFSILASHHSRQSTDPVHQLWDTLALGTPLCFLFNLLAPPATKIDVPTDPESIGVDQRKDQQKAAAFFIMGVQKLKHLKEWDETVELFTVTELMDQNKNTNGFVKVVGTVTHLLDKLPPHVFEEEMMPPSPLLPNGGDHFHNFTPKADDTESPWPTDENEKERNNIIRELLETERKFVQDLEVMQTYARSLIQEDVVDQDTIHHLFPGLNKLLDFQRRFLIGLEGTAEQPWREQHWGQHFIVNEESFQVYEPYCANYTNAADLMLVEEPNLMKLSHVIHPKSELPAFLIKPVQRICKYPLLLEQLAKRSSPKDYPLHGELVEGVAAAKRITDKVNEAQRRMENQATAKALESRVEDWKGHHLSNFGDLLLDDVFVVTKSDVDREYHVFLFEKIILCCKDNPPPPPATPGGSKKVSKSNSILKKQGPPGQSSLLAGGAAAAKKKTTPLLLKGRIFLNNVTKAVAKGQSAGQYPLQVWWRGDDDLEYFTLRCRTEEQLKQWETSINRMIKDNLLPDNRTMGTANSTNPAAGYQDRVKSNDSYRESHQRAPSVASNTSSSTLPPYPGPPRLGRFNNSEERIPPLPSGPYATLHHSGSHHNIPYGAGYQQSNSSREGGFDMIDGSEADEDWDESTSSHHSHYGGSFNNFREPSSGRGTPSGRSTPASRRATGVSQSMPPERDLAPGYERTRARTEDPAGHVMASWRNQANASRPPPPPPPNGSLPPPPTLGAPPLQTGPDGRPLASAYGQRPGLPRSNPGSSDGSFGPGGPTRSLRGQLSATRLRSTHEEGGERMSTYSRDPRINEPSIASRSPPLTTSSVSRVTGSLLALSASREQLAPPATRSRSLSNPSSANPPGLTRDRAPPPLPIAPQWSKGNPNGSRAVGGPAAGTNKRGSGSSASTGDSSEYSPSQTLSPITPYGSNESAANATIRPGYPAANADIVRVKVHYGVDIFMLGVSRSIEFWDLMDKIERKLKQCGKKASEGSAKLKYRDEDGDMVSLTTDDELQMAFEMRGQITLHVQR